MAIYGSTYPYYRDPREELDAISALANAGRPRDALTPEARSGAVSALANAGRPRPEPEQIDTPPDDGPVDDSTARAVSALLGSVQPPPPPPEPEPQPDPALAEAERARAASALAARVPVPPTPEPEPDPAIAETLKANAASALASRQPAPVVPEPEPDPEVARQFNANAARSLARTGEAIAPVVVRAAKAPPVPFVGAKMELLDPESKLTPEQFEAVARQRAKPDHDMEFTTAETDANAARAFGMGTDALKPKPDTSALDRMALVADKPPFKPDMVVDLGEVDRADQRGKPQIQPPKTMTVDEFVEPGEKKTPTDVSARSAEQPPEPTTSSTSPQPRAAVKESTTLTLGSGDKAAPVVKQVEVTSQPESRSLTERVNDANQNDPVGNAIRAATGAAMAGGSAVGAAEGPPGVNTWALVADIIANRGRGLGGIIAQAEQQKQQWLARQDKHKDDALNDEYKRAQIAHLQKTGAAQSDWEGDKSARDWENIRLREEENRRRGVSTQLAVDKYGNLIDADSKANTAKVIVTERNAAAGVRGRENEKHGLNDQMADDAANIARERSGATTDARQDVQHDNIDRTAKDAATVSGARAETALPYQQELKGTASPTEVRAEKDAALFRSPMPGVVIVDKPAWEAAHSNQAARQKTEEYVSGVNQSIEGLDKMIELRKKLGRQPLPEADAYQMRNLQKSVIGGESKAGNTGVLNGAEFPRYAGDVPDGSVGWSDVSDKLIDAVTGQPRDTVLEKLLGARAAAQHALDVGLKTRGARGETAEDRAAAVQAAIPPETLGKRGSPEEKAAIMATDYSDFKPNENALPVVSGKPVKVPAATGEMSDEGLSAAERASLAKQGTSETFKVKNKRGQTGTVHGGALGLADFMRDHDGEGWELVQ